MDDDKVLAKLTEMSNQMNGILQMSATIVKIDERLHVVENHQLEFNVKQDSILDCLDGFKDQFAEVTDDISTNTGDIRDLKSKDDSISGRMDKQEDKMQQWWYSSKTWDLGVAGFYTVVTGLFAWLAGVFGGTK